MRYRNQALAAIVVLSGIVALPYRASAQLLGASTTGSVSFGGNGGPNYFDPINGFVPTGYSNKTQGTTVIIAEPPIEFGFQDSALFTSANFTNNQLIITHVASSSIGISTYTFTSAAFTSLSEVSDNFLNGGATGTLSQNRLEVIIPTYTTPGTYQAVFNVGSAASAATPEPGSFALLGALSAVGVAWYKRRRK
jgi:hypothetical protein